MRRRPLVVLVGVAVVCAGVVTGLLDPAGSGWAVPRFRISSDGNGLYMPFDPARVEGRARIGVALLALGSGTAGASLVALLHGRRTRLGARSSRRP